MDRITYRPDGNAQSFEGPGAVDVFVMAALASGLMLYARSGLRPNRMWPPRAMMAAAERHTGQKFKARDYVGAAEALSAKVQAEKARIDAEAPK